MTQRYIYSNINTNKYTNTIKKYLETLIKKETKKFI